jgi:uroporphyrin-III C-methyltransferase
MNPGAPSQTASSFEVGSRAPEPGHVYLVGAGPGSPDLLTLRALHLLERAEVILPDDLVSDEVLALASPAALIIPVGKRCGQPRITQAGIHELMLLHAGQGKSVVRLKSGDPLVFGRANEEIEALRAAGIPFEIVPGITAAFAVAASLQTPLTDRNSASKLILATAHHAADKSAPIAWEGAFPADSTLVLYMPGRNFAALTASLVASGIPGETPVAAVSKASTPDEQVTATTLAELPASQPGPAPLLLLIGHAIQATASVHTRTP